MLVRWMKLLGGGEWCKKLAHPASHRVHFGTVGGCCGCTGARCPVPCVTVHACSLDEASGRGRVVQEAGPSCEPSRAFRHSGRLLRLHWCEVPRTVCDRACLFAG